LILLVGALGGILFVGGAVAPALADATDDTEYGSVYGRVRYLEGDLTVERTGEGAVTEGTVNDPVMPGDRLTTGDGRSEIGLADGSVVRMDRGTRLDVRNLSDINNKYENTNLFALERGAIRIDASEPDSKKTFRVDTEAGSIYLLSGGSFRIEIDDDATTVYSFRGVAELSGDEDSVLVRTGERSSVQPGRLPSDPRRFNTARLDDFDHFVEDRQEAFLRHDGGGAPRGIVEEAPYEVQPYVSELSYYGSWHRVPSYGWVWRPVYHGSWGPYVNGYWSWCRGGWVWVSYDPWGWAPYHYGRWDFAVDIGWVWIPGRVWSGAWVSFAVGPSYVGWCPLNYYNRPVFHDVTIINAVSVNVTRLEPRGWRFVSADRFADRRAGRTFVRADRLPRGTDVVITSRLPGFNPRDIARGPEHGVRLVETVRRSRTPLPAAVGRDNRPVPFRSLEKVVEPRSRRGRPAPQTQDRPREQRGHSVDRPGRPGEGARAPAPGPGTTTRPRGRPAGPERQAEPRHGTRQQEGAQQQDRGRDSSGSQDRPRGEKQRPQAGSLERPRREPPRPESRPDQVIERLFDGVRGDRGRARVEPPRVQPPRVQPPRVQPPRPARPGAAPARPERRPDPRPPAPPRPQQQKKQDKGHDGHNRH
jgi:hypothetical protein